MAHGGSKRKPCSVEGCGTLAVSRGLCVKHGGDTARKPCLVEGCGTLARNRGLCKKHGEGSKRPCLVEGCGTLAVSRVLCAKHGGAIKRKPCSVRAVMRRLGWAVQGGARGTSKR